MHKFKPIDARNLCLDLSTGDMTGTIIYGRNSPVGKMSDGLHGTFLSLTNTVKGGGGTITTTTPTSPGTLVKLPVLDISIEVPAGTQRSAAVDKSKDGSQSGT